MIKNYKENGVIRMTEKRYTRRISKCYIVEEDSMFPDKLIKICRSKRLAEHYVRVLTPKWKEAFGFGLRVSEMPFYEDLDYETEIVEIAEDSDIE